MRKPVFVALLLQLTLCGIVASDTGDEGTRATGLDWPQWRGVNRDGLSAETGLLDEWPEGGPKQIWRIEVGEGYSGVVVADGKLYTMWDDGGSQFLFCLDALTGKVLWRHALGESFTNHYGNGPRSTPLVDDGVVYAIGTQGLLLAANRKNGRTLWQHDLVKDYRSKLPSYGYSSSPLIVGNNLVIEAGARGSAYIAFDKRTGEVAWTSGTDRPAYSSPISVTIDGMQQIVFWSAHGLHSVSADNGDELWNYSWETFCPMSGDPLNTGTPIFVAPDRIYISSGSGATLVRVSRTGESFQVAPLWKSELMRSDVNSPLLLGDHIYGFDRGILKSLDTESGDIAWKARGFQRGSLIAADGRLIVLGEEGNLALVDGNPDEFYQVDSADILTGKNWTSPALAEGKLYLRNQEELVCLDLKSPEGR
jgi:outer membrane protein assembly factor BamB